MTQTQMTKPAASSALQKFQSVADLLQSDKVQAAIARALPSHLTPERMVRVAMTAIQKTPKLAECDQRSLIGAIIQAAELGLEPNTPLGHAYLIPFFNSKTKRLEAQLMPGYRGLIALARRSGQVQGIYAEIVYEKDYFEVSYGLNKDLIHRPALNEEDRGRMVGAYAVAKFKDGYVDFEYMDAVQIQKIRSRSKSADSGPWVTDTGEMWRKTPIRRLVKRLPLSVEDATLERAISIDDSFNDIAPLELGTGSTYVITEEQRVYLVDLAKDRGVTEYLKEILDGFGFEMLANITTDRFEDVIAAIEAATPPSKARSRSAAAASAAAPDLSVEVNELLGIKFEGDDDAIQTFLNGRKVAAMDNAQLEALKAELAKV